MNTPFVILKKEKFENVCIKKDYTQIYVRRRIRTQDNIELRAW